MSRTRTELRPVPAHKLSPNLYDIYHCCVYSEKLLLLDRGTVRKVQSFIRKKKFEKLGHLVSFIIRIYHEAQSSERQIHSASRKCKSLNAFTYSGSACCPLNLRFPECGPRNFLPSLCKVEGIA